MPEGDAQAEALGKDRLSGAGASEKKCLDPGLAGNPTNYVHLPATLLSFQGVEIWGEQLDGLNDEEYEVPCPVCGSENFIAFGRYGFFSTTDGMYMKPTTARKVPLRPQAPAALDGLAQRLHVDHRLFESSADPLVLEGVWQFRVSQ
ncbi:hypothetical protein [Streptomyces lutosisoli]|uniref:Uncharacterized protein n=1 Tax=Streptomyces lutosisoli TaxID=2665721 RepID=A0ABW2VEU2_9ACTN